MLDIPNWKRLGILLVCFFGLFFALPNGFYNRVEQSNDALALIQSGETSPELEMTAAQWPGWLPSGLVNLGLDLRGGAHLLAEVQLSDVYKTQLQALWPEVRDALRAERSQIGTVRLQTGADTELRVRISQPQNIARAVEVVQGLATDVPNFITGGVQSDIEVRAEDDVIVVTLSEAQASALDERTMLQSIEIVRRRVDEVGTREPTIQRQGSNRILIQVPGIGSADELKALLGTTALLTFQPVIATTTNASAASAPGSEVLPSMDDDQVFYVLEQTAVVSGEDLVDAQPSFDENGSPAVNFRFNATAARAFGDYTLANIGSPFAIVLDGEVVSAPVIQSHIPGGSGIITGDFSIQESTRLAVLLRAGSLPAGLNFLEERTVGPQLGQDSVDAGKVATTVAFAGVLIFMFLSYGLFGIFANIALIINIALIFALLSLIGATLTLPGIAGIVLTVGMAVDANVLVFERIKEELTTAKGPARAIELGYERALSAILDANVTTFITAVILYAMGSGPVRGFAITLGLGILTSVFTAIFVTRFLLVSWFQWRKPKTIEV